MRLIVAIQVCVIEHVVFAGILIATNENGGGLFTFINNAFLIINVLYSLRIDCDLVSIKFASSLKLINHGGMHIFETFWSMPRITYIDEAPFGLHYLECNKWLHDVVNLFINGLVATLRAFLEDPTAYHFDIKETLAMVNHYPDNLENSALMIEQQMIIDRYLQHLLLLSF